MGDFRFQIADCQALVRHRRPAAELANEGRSPDVAQPPRLCTACKLGCHNPAVIFPGVMRRERVLAAAAIPVEPSSAPAGTPGAHQVLRVNRSILRLKSPTCNLQSAIFNPSTPPLLSSPPASFSARAFPGRRRRAGPASPAAAAPRPRRAGREWRAVEVSSATAGRRRWLSATRN